MVQVIQGDILTYQEVDYSIYICHQTNCTTTLAYGLASKIFNKYPETNIYTSQIERHPGTFIMLPTKDGKHVVNLNGQFSPSKPSIDETKQTRLLWMTNALDQLSNDIKVTMANCYKGKMLFLFPAKMGCDLAGGDWNDYYALICNFADKNKNYITVKIINFN